MIKSIKYLLLLTMLFNFSACGYNKLVSHQEAIEKSWTIVENSYSKRADVVSQFISTLKQNKNVKSSEITALEKSLKNIESIAIPKDDLSPKTIENFMKKQEELSNILREAMNTEGNATKSLSTIEKAHNSIREARRKFNNTVSEYNTYKRQFPQSVTASPMGFENFEPLKIDSGSRKM